MLPLALAGLVSGCGLVLDLDPDDRRPGDALDGGRAMDGATPADAKPGDAGGHRWDAGGDLDGSVWTDGGVVDPADAGGVEDGGGGPRPDGGVVLPDDAGLGDAGRPAYCTPVDCDGDGTPENLAEDRTHCGECDRPCGLLYCCNGMCVAESTCAIVC